MIDGFTASNGWVVQNGDLCNPSGDSEASNTWDGWAAMREYFIAEHDAQMKRWRSKLKPEFVVYLKVDEDGDHVMFDESNPTEHEVQYFNSREKHKAGTVEHEFFTTADIPKAWHFAVEGEVWMLEVDSEPEKAYMVQASTAGLGGFDFYSPSIQCGTKYTGIKSAYRLFPEED
ncbi:MAG: hypothetical protein ACRC5T_04375 [Cetobacterium sp.]